jgi:ribonuclease HI
MATKKYYVVWEGRKTGIFDNWKDCELQIKGHPAAKYKSFTSKEAAIKAFNGDARDFIGKEEKSETGLNDAELKKIGKPILDSISVDAAWNHVSKAMEYRGVDTRSGAELFRKGPFEDATNNVGEFLAIVHALALLKKMGNTFPIYSDSRNAINWVKQKKHNSNLKRTKNNAIIFDLLERADKWLKENTWSNKILKWETKAWGENPADFGRK